MSTELAEAASPARGEIPDGLRQIRNLYPVARCDAETWKKVHDLAMTGDADDLAAAKELARKCTLENPRLRARHDGAITARIKRNEFLVVQRAREREISAAMRRGAERMTSAINRHSGADGVVSAGRMARALDALRDINREMYAEVNGVFLGLLRKAAEMGLRGAMAKAQSVILRARAIRYRQREAGESYLHVEKVDDLITLSEADPLAVKVKYAAKSTMFRKLFKGVLRDTMAAGLFGKTGVSNRVWDLRDQNFMTIKRLVVGGISRGDSAAQLSRIIRGLLVQPQTLRGEAFDDAAPGVGVYRSAYKNAMRLTRTESNRAYVGADAAFADEKGWKLVYQVSSGQREFDSCDFYNGKVMTPEEFMDTYPQHPQCICYSTIAVPDVG